MPKNQYEICLEVLRRLDKEDILKDLIIIGGWCHYFYKYYFNSSDYNPSIRTRDLDFLVPLPIKIKRKIDIPQILNEIGFIIDFKGSKGYIRLVHPELFVEFLVPELGRGTDSPYPLPQLGLNAISLRFLNFLTENIIRIKVEDFRIAIPHPANFALHKLIIFQRRIKEEKVIKDRNSAIEVLKALIKQGETKIIKRVFESVPQKWQRKILKGLEKLEEKEIIDKLTVSTSTAR